MLDEEEATPTHEKSWKSLVKTPYFCALFCPLPLPPSLSKHKQQSSFPSSSRGRISAEKKLGREKGWSVRSCKSSRKGSILKERDLTDVAIRRRKKRRRKARKEKQPKSKEFHPFTCPQNINSQTSTHSPKLVFLFQKQSLTDLFLRLWLLSFEHVWLLFSFSCQTRSPSAARLEHVQEVLEGDPPVAV